jgi:hypothetical protein
MAGFFPHSGQRVVHRRKRRMQIRTGAGVVELQVLQGQDPADNHWGCPIRERWGLSDHQQLSLALEDKLAFTVTATGSYGQAAQLAQKWGVGISAAAMHALAQRLGSRAEAATQERLVRAPQEKEPQRAAPSLAVLMLDGWQVRQRGPGWGKERTDQPRVQWHEWKTGIYYRHEQSGRTAGGRGVLAQKLVVGWQGEPVEFGRRLHWEAMSAGLGRARSKLIVADGAPWIWNLAQDRWAGATEVLDFYHATQHLWELGRALVGDDEAKLTQWVEPRRRQLRHGKQGAVLSEIASLVVPSTETGKVIKREQDYFAGHAQRMNYGKIHRKGWPIGSGSVESECRNRQCRFKRPGQTWTARGMHNLGALTEARQNGHWDQLWDR